MFKYLKSAGTQIQDQRLELKKALPNVQRPNELPNSSN